MLADSLKAPSVHLVWPVLTITLVAYVVFQRWISSLAKFPGPWAASLSKYWLVRHTMKGQLHRELIRLHDRYGPVVRIAPNELSVADLGAIRRIYGKRRTKDLSSGPGAIIC